jgi:hypothetical protein
LLGGVLDGEGRLQGGDLVDRHRGLHCLRGCWCGVVVGGGSLRSEIFLISSGGDLPGFWMFISYSAVSISISISISTIVRQTQW